MKKLIIISTLIIIVLSASQLIAGKDIANHVVVPTPGANTVSGVDEQGNLFVLNITYSNGVVLTATFKAINNKGKEYSSGNLPELVGAVGAGFAGGVSFGKKSVILGSIDAGGGKWYSYKLSKKGATKLGEMKVINTVDTTQNVLLWHNKVVVNTIISDPMTLIKTNKFEQYNIKLQKMEKTMEGVSDQAWITGKAAVFLTTAGIWPNQTNYYKIQKPAP